MVVTFRPTAGKNYFLRLCMDHGCNIFTGIIAGIIADLIILGVITYFSREYAEIQPIISSMDLIIIFTIVILLGVIISTLATAFAVNRYVKMKSDQLYYV